MLLRGYKVRVKDNVHCSPYWHGRVGVIVDIEYDEDLGGLLWSVRIDKNDDVTVPFADHELERI